MSTTEQSGDKLWEIVYHPLVSKDIKNIDKKTCQRIARTIESKLGLNPLLYGVPLKASLQLFFKLRIGDYRVIYVIRHTKVVVLVIGHRKDVYSLAERRLSN